MSSRETFERRLFWIVSRTCFMLYRTFPLFGPLRASLAIIRRNHEFLVIERNDGRGVSLPGGIARWKEADEGTLRREVLEETGLEIAGEKLITRYPSRADLPCTISVFEVQTNGELKSSWEGSPRWLSIAEIAPRILKSQQPVVELLRQMSAAKLEDSPANR